MSKAAKLFREVPIEAARFARGKYPDFVTDRRPAPLGQEAPVFMFHDVAPDRFELQMRYLSDNGYRTLTMEEFMAFLKGDFRLKGPSVLLTFDDGHKSWHKTAFPLLRRYDFHGVGFLVTSFILPHPAEDSFWLSWPEVREVQSAGAMTFESHTAFHDRVFVSRKVIGFLRPGCFSSPMGLDAPWSDSNGQYTNLLPFGAPIYPHAPRLAGLPRFFDDPDVRAACAEFVASRGGAAFFQRRGWRRLLRRVWDSTRKKTPPQRFESGDEQRAAILGGMALSRLTLEEHLQREARHLCFPWGAGGDLAASLSREAGYHSNFLVAGPRNSSRPGDSPWQVPRLKDDYIFRLPGSGRKSLASIFADKLRRRAARSDIY